MHTRDLMEQAYVIRQALGTHGDGGDEQLPQTLPALIILYPHTRLLVGQQENLSMRSAHKCGADQISALLVFCVVFFWH